MKPMILTLACAFCLSAAQAEEPVKLKMQYHVGKKYTQNMSMEQEMAFDVQGQKFEQLIEMDSRIVMDVTEGDQAGTKNIAISYERISQSVDMNGQKMAYDSDKPEEGNPMLAMGLKGLVGKKFNIVMNDQLQVTEVKGLDKLMEGVDAATAAATQKMLSKDYLEQMFNVNMTQSLPKKAVVKGDSWDVNYSQAIPDMGAVKVSGKMSHEGQEEVQGNNCVKLSNEFKMVVDLPHGDRFMEISATSK